MAAGRFLPLKLRAEDVEDITVLAACLQDATLKVGDMVWQPKQRRFVLVLNRFRWEDETPKLEGQPQPLIRATPHARVQAGLHFDGVLSVQSSGIDRGQPTAALDLLSILADPAEDGAATLTLVFAGGSAVKLEVECVDAQMQDLGQPWLVRRAPQHKEV
jgi:hypothetical protein